MLLFGRLSAAIGSSLVVALVLSACGDSKNETAGFAKRADGICQAQLVKVYDIEEPDASDYFRRFADLQRGGLRSLRALVPPSAVRDEFDAYLELHRDLIAAATELQRAYKSGNEAPTGDIARFNRLRTDQTRLERNLGLRTCDELGEQTARFRTAANRACSRYVRRLNELAKIRENATSQEVVAATYAESSREIAAHGRRLAAIDPPNHLRDNVSELVFLYRSGATQIKVLAVMINAGDRKRADRQFSNVDSTFELIARLERGLLLTRCF